MKVLCGIHLQNGIYLQSYHSSCECHKNKLKSLTQTCINIKNTLPCFIGIEAKQQQKMLAYMVLIKLLSRVGDRASAAILHAQF